MQQQPSDGQRGFIMRFVHRIGTRITLLVAAALGLSVVVGGIIIAKGKASLQAQVLHDQAQLTQAYGSAVQQYLNSAATSSKARLPRRQSGSRRTRRRSSRPCTGCSATRSRSGERQCWAPPTPFPALKGCCC